MSTSHYMPQPGDFGLLVGGGVVADMVVLGQWVVGDLSRYTHAFLVLDNGQVIEAEPGGAKINPLNKYLEGRREVLWSSLPLTEDQRATVVRTGRSLEGTPYSFLGYVYLGLSHFKHCPDVVKQQVTTSNKMICSQLVDYCYRQAGYQLFDDGRLPQDVTPGDLARLLQSRVPSISH